MFLQLGITMQKSELGVMEELNVLTTICNQEDQKPHPTEWPSQAPEKLKSKKKTKSLSQQNGHHTRYCMSLS